ncbi:MAG: NAD(P)-dependent oxidoreductase [Oscillatoriales cyanobacterium RM2_1_1]|nr:NAD(P)-dependent oxidoreductase [Oscillatoriales cyanobacterium SM2_3_0]NJO45966.1 NAD(P)-dependent oxidoreductase [Oscillatoriales cyanobacterium RM2_1_1]
MELGTSQVLVTGALGWLGISLVKALVAGLPDYESLSQPQPNLKIRCLILPGQDPGLLQAISPTIQVIQGDLRSPTDCNIFCENSQDSILFHTAGVIHPRKISEFYQVNLDGTKNLLESAISAQVKRAVIVSSNSPCGCNPHPDHLFDQASPYYPYMNYGRSKMLMELAVQEYFRAGRIETVIIRPPWFYGPHQPPRQTLFFKLIRDGKGPIVGSGENLRSMAYIDHLTQGLILAGTTEIANGKTYWIADHRPYTMNEIINTVERLLESEFNQICAHKRLKFPGIASEIALVTDSLLQSLGIYHQKIHVLSEMNKTIACSITAAQQELNYSPGISLEEGMRRSLKWVFQQDGGLG